jgi:nucleotide-binding universal stress UspA family protein
MSPLSVTTAVVGYDGSPASDRAARRAAEALADDGRIVLVTATPALTSQGLNPEPLLETPSRGERDQILTRGRDLLHELGIEAHAVASDEQPAEAIATVAAAEAADLIIVGATGAGFVARAILGSTPAAILRLAPCDVLVVR